MKSYLSIKLLISIVLTLNLILLGYSNQITARIWKNTDGTWSIQENDSHADYIAEAKYNKTLETTGWDFLAISTNKAYTDEEQAEAAGRIEGYLTAERIWNHYNNLNVKSNWKNSTTMPEYIQHFFKSQREFVLNSYKTNPEDSIIANAYLIQKQFDGMVEAYNGNVKSDKQITSELFHTMSSFGDLFDIIYYNSTESRPDFMAMSVREVENYVLKTSHCSALFKVKEDFSDVYFAHNSWFYYSAMNRIFKEYNFNFNNPSVKAKNVLFSSYAATLASMDDFYVTSQDLAVIETTNPFFNNDLYSKVNPSSLLCWQRAMIANRISTTSEEWVNNFAKFNSGTYNNMFMALDMKKVDLVNKTIDDKAFFIIEQIPGETAINDVTQVLKYGYWPSYNSPYSKDIRVKSKIEEMITNKPELVNSLDYSKCSRANIFRRDHGKVTSLDEMKKIIRYNDYLNDPLSLKNPTGTISARGDLDNACLGAYDAKVGSISQAKGRNKVINIISGPTYDTQPVFSFSNSSICANDPRMGLVDTWKFSWIEYKIQYPEISIEESLAFLS